MAPAQPAPRHPIASRIRGIVSSAGEARQMLAPSLHHRASSCLPPTPCGQDDPPLDSARITSCDVSGGFIARPSPECIVPQHQRHTQLRANYYVIASDAEQSIPKTSECAIRDKDSPEKNGARHALDRRCSQVPSPSRSRSFGADCDVRTRSLLGDVRTIERSALACGKTRRDDRRSLAVDSAYQQSHKRWNSTRHVGYDSTSSTNDCHGRWSRPCRHNSLLNPPRDTPSHRGSEVL